MSYILDALRRADAERERGAVPSIHAQQFGQLPTDDEPAAPRGRMLWIVAGLVLVLVALLAWILLGREATRLPPSPPMAAQTPAAPAAATTLPPATPAPVAIAPAIPTATPPRAVPPPAPSADSRVATPIKPPHRSVRPAPVAKAGEPATAAAERPAGAERPAAAAPAREPSESKVVAQRDLPADIRNGMPKIAINGSTYSSEPSSRMLMIGGQIFHEGDPVVGGVVLRQVKPHAAVFSYRGYLYELGF